MSAFGGCGFEGSLWDSQFGVGVHLPATKFPFCLMYTMYPSPTSCQESMIIRNTV